MSHFCQDAKRFSTNITEKASGVTCPPSCQVDGTIRGAASLALVEIEKKVLVPHEVIHLAITFTPIIFTLPTKHELKLKNRAQLAPLTQQHLIKTKLKHKSRAFVIRAAVFLFKIKPQAVSLLVLPCLTLSISHEYSINILAGGVWRILEHKH